MSFYGTLLFVSSSNTPNKCPITKSSFTIGSDKGCDLFISKNGASTCAEIIYEPECKKSFIHPLENSTIFVNGQIVQKIEKRFLEHKDRITYAGRELIYECKQETIKPAIKQTTTTPSTPTKSTIKRKLFDNTSLSVERQTSRIPQLTPILVNKPFHSPCQTPVMAKSKSFFVRKLDSQTKTPKQDQTICLSDNENEIQQKAAESPKAEKEDSLPEVVSSSTKAAESPKAEKEDSFPEVVSSSTKAFSPQKPTKPHRYNLRSTAKKETSANNNNPTSTVASEKKTISRKKK